MAKKLISVVVPVYSIKEEYLRRCLDSMMNQNSDQFKVILIDDGSPDQSGMICDEYAARSDLFQVIHQKNAGVSVARNVGIDASDTEWITFADPDDWIDDGAIERELSAINDAADADILMFDYSREYLNESRVESLNVQSGFLDESLMDACQKAPFYKLVIEGRANPFSINAIWNKVYRRDFILSRAIRFVPEARKGQDRLFNAEAFNAANRVFYLNQHLYNYRCNEDSVSNKYNENIVDLTLIEIAGLQRIIDRHHLPVLDLLNARICTRLYPCMRLYYFHPSNPESSGDKLRDFKALIEKEPFHSAVQTVRMELLSFSEKVFVYCLKYKLYGICRMLVLIKSSQFDGKLNK